MPEGFKAQLIEGIVYMPITNGNSIASTPAPNSEPPTTSKPKPQTPGLPREAEQETLNLIFLILDQGNLVIDRLHFP
jgi:hypothetical protein